MTYVLLSDTNDADITVIAAEYSTPSVARFVSIDTDNYWRYVTGTPGVCFYKILRDGSLVGTLHCELCKGVLYLSVVVFEKFRNAGIATEVLCDVKAEKLCTGFDKIGASIDESNLASIRAFEKAGFIRTAKNDELYEYEYIK